MSAASFLVFFQSYLVAPLVPALANELHATLARTGLLVPAYMLPYGLSTLFYGPLSDRFGRRAVILSLLSMTVITVGGVATAGTMDQLLLWRVAGGVSSGGVVPVGLALLGDLFPYRERGRAIGWMFGAMAGGMAFGSTVGALFNPVIGWRNEFWLTALIAVVVLGFAIRHRTGLECTASKQALNLPGISRVYWQLVKNTRAARAYSFIFLNGVFHSGIFSWLGLYFSTRFQLGDRGIGLALLGYGLPGMCLGPAIGKLADRTGRSKLILVRMDVFGRQIYSARVADSMPAEEEMTELRKPPVSEKPIFGPGADPLLDCHKAAAFLGVHPRTLQRMVLRGEIHAVRVGKLYRFVPSAIQDWVLEHNLAS